MSDERRGPLTWLASRSVEAVDFDEVLAGMDLDAALAQVDVDALVQRVDVDAVVRRVDVNALMDRVDVNAVLDRVDVNRLLDRVEPDALLDRVDVNRLLDRANVQRLVDRVDVATVVDRAGIADIVTQSTGAVAGSMIDVGRRQLVALDAIVEGVAYRVLRRDSRQRPESPSGIPMQPSTPAKDGRAQVTGHYAGPVSRAVALLLDAAVVFWAFTAAAVALTWLAGWIGWQLPVDTTEWLLPVLSVSWAFSYWFVSLALAGRTIGKSVAGVTVVSADGTPLTGGQAFVRTLLMPVSFALFGLGVLVVLVAPRRTALHDAVARTCTIYDWGDRAAELPAPLTAWIDRHADESQP